MSDYSQFAQTNPGTDYPVKDALLRAQLSLDSDKVDSGAVGHAFGYKRNTTAGLNVGYYGGVVISGGALTTIADGTIALTASQTNYVERTAAGVVSKNTAGFTAGKIPMFTAVTDATDVTAVVDKRQRNVFGDLVAAGTLVSAGVASFADGTEGAPGVSFISDPDSGLYRIDENHIGIAVNGAHVLGISAAGIDVAGAIATDGEVGVAATANAAWGPVSAGPHKSVDGYLNILGGATTTIMTVATKTALLMWVEQGADSYGVAALVHAPEGAVAAVVTPIYASHANLQIVASGLDVQVYNGAGTTRTVSFRALRFF